VFVISKFRRKRPKVDGKKVFYNINENITAPEVRLISDDGKQLGQVSINEALNIAEGAGLDLVEISPNANPPVCRVLDYGKFVYEKKKKEKESKKKQKQTSLKEIKLSPKITEHDIEHKVKHARKFLEAGDRVKLNMRFRGRERMYSERGIEIMKNFFNIIEDIAEIEQEPNMDGWMMFMTLVPKKKK
jgi:translation initiation factor IF-3